jgi:hypothetical protein
LVKEIAQRQLTNLSYPSRTELQAVGGPIDEALILQALEGLLESLDVACRVVTQVSSHRFDIYFG